MRNTDKGKRLQSVRRPDFRGVGRQWTREVEIGSVWKGTI